MTEQAEKEAQEALSPIILRAKSGELSDSSPGEVSAAMLVMVGWLPRISYLAANAMAKFSTEESKAMRNRALTYAQAKAEGLTPSAAKIEADLSPGYAELKALASLSEVEFQRLNHLREDVISCISVLKYVERSQESEARLTPRV